MPAQTRSVDALGVSEERSDPREWPGYQQAAAVAQFHHDFAQRYRLIDLTPLLVARAMTLAETYGLRGYDAVQLTAAVEIHVRGLTLGLPALTLVSADEEFSRAARVEGLSVEGPNAH